MAAWPVQLTQDGYALLPGVFTSAEIENAVAGCSKALAQAQAQESVLASANGPAYGARNLLRLWPDVLSLLRTSLLGQHLACVLGQDAGAVRVLYFDKPPGHSWALPWHRDLTIAVRQHGALGTFAKPTRKAGVPHVEAPPTLLSEMLTARIHLDAVTENNGPLWVIPGSHVMTEKDALTGQEPIPVHCQAGDVLLMRPMLLHSSRHSSPDHQLHRRIIHVECAASRELPDGYEWYDYELLAPIIPMPVAQPGRLPSH